MDIKAETELLLRRCATRLPSDVERALRKAAADEKSSEVLKRIIQAINISKKKSVPLCQDTGTPVFYITYNSSQSTQAQIMKKIQSALNSATLKVPLRPNAFEVISGKNTGNRAVFHFSEGKKLKITLMLKGGGSENITRVYSLPDSALKAERNINGAQKCIIDSVKSAQGKGCPPYIVGVGVAGLVDEALRISKEQLLRRLDDQNKEPKLISAERMALASLNKLGIGPLGLGGKTTALAVKIGVGCRHPASYFVAVSFGCWCMRRGNYES